MLRINNPHLRKEYEEITSKEEKIKFLHKRCRKGSFRTRRKKKTKKETEKNDKKADKKKHESGNSNKNSNKNIN